MDAKTSELHREYQENPADSQTLQPPKLQVATAKTQPPAVKTLPLNKAPQKPSRNRRRGREVVKSGMAASLAVSVLTGLKIIRPMRFHPIASWAFVGLTLLHMLMYDSSSKKK